VPHLEVADIFRAHGPTLRQRQRGHLSLGQLKVMSAIEQCRSAALGGHVLRCSACAQPQIAYNSCLMGSFPLRGVWTKEAARTEPFHRPLHRGNSPLRRVAVTVVLPFVAQPTGDSDA
jgi:hypothetical protein